MKTREEFVTNSSSSSFVVIKYSDKPYSSYCNGKDLIIGEVGETEFGWRENYYSNFYDKLNFAYMQTMYSENDCEHWRKMLNNVLKEAGFNRVLVPLDFDGYIDHASNASEGENTEMFATEESLAYFLFNDGSYIRTDNDNH